MAVDAFLKIEGITDKVRGGEIQLESFSWGVSNTSTIGGAGGGAGAGKASFQDFSFTALVGEQSPKLFEAAAMGQPIRNAMLRVTDKIEPFMITFSSVLISSYKLDEGAQVSQKCFDGDLPGVQRGVPMENVSFNFLKIEFQVGGTIASGGPSGIA